MIEIKSNPSGVTDTHYSIILNYPKTVKPLKKEEIISPVEFYKRQLEEILSNQDNINDTKLYLLSYIKVYGQEYKKEVLASRICTSMDSINNYESVLRSYNLIQGYWPDTVINPEIKLQNSDYIYITYVKMDQSLNDVKHKIYKK